MSELKSIAIKDITMLTNYRDVEPVNEKDPEIIELSKSILKHGVMQPILVRPNKKPGHYELIFGHRRLIACKIAKLDEIPCNIKEVSDDQILEHQVTENLQRKDVHPMDEAIAFKSLMDKMKYSVEEISARFAKKPEFVLQRLKLNDLIPEAQKLFKQNTILTGHAFLLARLTKADQLSIIKNQRDFGSVSQLNDHISRNIIRNLAEASFDIKDPNLFPQAGSCLNCPKRSGSHSLLFADIKTPDRCFDKECFSIKSAKAFTIKLQEIIETRPEIKLVRDRYNPFPKEVNDYVQKMKVKVLVDNDDCDNSTWSGSRFKIKAKGFFLNGFNAGKIKDIYLPGKSTAKNGKSQEDDPEIVIAGIKERTARAKVLDTCKIHHAIIAAVKEKKEMNDKPYPLQAIDRGIMIFLLLTSAGIEDDTIKGVPEIKDDKGYDEDYFKKLSNVSDDSLGLIIRKVVNEKFRHEQLQWGVHVGDTPIKIIAEYLGIDTNAIVKAQHEIADKRDGRAKQRIAALQPKNENKKIKKLAKR